MRDSTKMRTHCKRLVASLILTLLMCTTVHTVADTLCSQINGEPSDCLKLTQCPVLFNYIRMPVMSTDARNTLRSLYCGSDNRIPKVCCPRNEHKNLHLLPQDDCGEYDTSKTIGGMQAGLNEFPWMALLSYRVENQRRFGCGGSLINEKYVLTAAHCIEKNLLGVRIGEHTIGTREDCRWYLGQRQCSEGVQDFNIEKVIVHQHFVFSSLDNDVALIRLQGRVNIARANAGLICLPLYSYLQEHNLAGSSVMVAGWGATKMRRSSEVLQKISVPVISNELCKTQHRYLTPKKMCAGYWGNDTCKGDSGGPLISSQRFDNKTAYVQYGIVTWGTGLECGDEGQGVYTRVTAYVDWILDNVEP